MQDVGLGVLGSRAQDAEEGPTLDALQVGQGVLVDVLVDVVLVGEELLELLA